MRYFISIGRAALGCARYKPHTPRPGRSRAGAGRGCTTRKIPPPTRCQCATKSGLSSNLRNSWHIASGYLNLDVRSDCVARTRPTRPHTLRRPAEPEVDPEVAPTAEAERRFARRPMIMPDRGRSIWGGAGYQGCSPPGPRINLRSGWLRAGRGGVADCWLARQRARLGRAGRGRAPCHHDGLRLGLPPPPRPTFRPSPASPASPG